MNEIDVLKHHERGALAVVEMFDSDPVLVLIGFVLLMTGGEGGKDVTIVTWGAMVHVALEAAEKAAKRGIEPEIIDLRTILPFDAQTCIDSVRRTGRLIVLQEAQYTGGLGHTVSSRILDCLLYTSDAANE